MGDNFSTSKGLGPSLEELAQAADAQIDQDAGDYYGDRRGFCDRCNGILAHAAIQLGYPAEIVQGWFGSDEDELHTWVRVGTTNIDLAGAQFGRPRIYLFTADADYHPRRISSPSAAPTEMYDEDWQIVAAICRRLQPQE
jgi:hypothetical protein